MKYFKRKLMNHTNRKYFWIYYRSDGKRMEVYADIHNGSWVKSNSILPDGTPKHGNCKIIPITEAEYMLEMI